MSRIESRIDDYRKAKAALDAHDASHAPLIAARDKLQAEFEPKLREMNERIKAANGVRSPLHQEVTFLQRALGPKILDLDATTEG